MTRTARQEAKIADLWNARNVAFEQAQWFPASYYQRRYQRLERNLWAYIAAHGPFTVTFTNGHTLELNEGTTHA